MEVVHKRGKNYTELERETLIELVKKHEKVIECKITNGTNNNLKKQAWSKIELEYNSQIPNKRTAKELKECYEGHKKKLKKRAATDRMEAYKTGGGPKPPPQVKVSDELLLNLIKGQVVPPPSQFDSSAKFLGDVHDTTIILGDDSDYEDISCLPEYLDEEFDLSSRPSLSFGKRIVDVESSSTPTSTYTNPGQFTVTSRHIVAESSASRLNNTKTSSKNKKSRQSADSESPASTSNQHDSGKGPKRRLVDVYNKVVSCGDRILEEYKSKEDYARELFEGKMKLITMETEHKAKLYELEIQEKLIDIEYKNKKYNL